MAQRFFRPGTELPIDRAILITFPGQRALDIAHSRTGFVFSLIRVRRGRIIIRGIRAVVVIVRAVVRAVGIEPVAVRIEKERIVDEPKAVVEMATMPVPMMIAPAVPVPVPAAGVMSRDDVSISLTQPLRTISGRSGSRRELRIRA